MKIHMHRWKSVMIGVVTVMGVASCSSGSAISESAEPLLVAGAADLQPAFEELGDRFTAETGQAVTFTFGSSGQLSQQIINGAPFEVFASANVSYADDVIDAGRADESSKHTYAFGRIVVWTRNDKTPDAVELPDLLDRRFTTVAIANPEHAPYGVAAVEALRSTQLYDRIEPKLVYGENISDTLRLATSGNADAAIVALSLALATDGGRYTEIEASAHETLEQAMVVTAEADRIAAATRFSDFIASAEGREIMTRYGFVLPGEQSPAGDGPN